MIKMATPVPSGREVNKSDQTPTAVSPDSTGRVCTAGADTPVTLPVSPAQADAGAGTSPRIIPVGSEFEHADGEALPGAKRQAELERETIRRSRPDELARRGRKSSVVIQPVKFALQLHREFVIHAMAGLRRAAIAVWMAMFNASRLGAVEIGHRRLADVAGLGLRHVGAAIRELESYGLVVVERRGRYTAGRSVTSTYRIFGKPTRPIEKRSKRGGSPAGGVSGGSAAAGD